VRCLWRSRHNETPADVRISWSANLPTPSELWVRFMRPDAATLLREVRLGMDLVGRETFTTDDLGFDPSTEKWALSIVLKEVKP